MIVLWCVLVLGTIAGSRGFNVDTDFPIVFEGKPRSYFGFGVALHRNRDGPWALVTAPRANSSVLAQLVEPGVLYKCKVEENPNCQEIVLDKKGNTVTRHSNSDYSYHDLKHGMWLGVSLDVRHGATSGNNDVVTCGHKWINQLYHEHHLTNGVCYVINVDLDTNKISKLLPFVDRLKQAINPPGIYEYAFGQVGTSAAFSDDGKLLLLGAPGYWDWTGTVVSYVLSSEKKNQNYTQYSVPSPSIDQMPSPEPYIGYSVTSGKFYDDGADYVAMGAPRDGALNGRIYIYKATNAGKSLVVHSKKEGSQLGEYYGASVLGIRLNSDSYTDLLVGAPLYSSVDGIDEGKVYVYLSNGLGLQSYSELYGNRAHNARFGTALANAGDLNQDGYNDVAIGAPYEDGNGVVYIYHGSRNGIAVHYVQRIPASEISSTISGFGIHISRGFDIDSNQYPDLLIGAYASSNALLFKTKPVVQLSARMRILPKQIDTNMTTCHFQGNDYACVNVTACLLYAGKHVPRHLDFEHEIVVEPTSQVNLVAPRAFFTSGDKSSTLISMTTRLDGGRDNCIVKELLIRKDIKDVITPVLLLYRYAIAAPEREVKQFNASFPVVDTMSPSNITSLVGFHTGCGTDDKCLSDLSVRVVVLGNTDNPLVIGENLTLSLVVEISNAGEPAYMSELLVHLPSCMPSKNQDICTEAQGHNASLVCQLGNPLLRSKKILLKIDLTKIPTDIKRAAISFEARTASSEMNPRKNKTELPLQLKAIADISITGSPSHDQMSYGGKSDEKTSVLITHTYFVMNHGPSPVQAIDILLHVPTSFEKSNGVEFVVFRSVEADSGKQSIHAKCNVSAIDIQPIVTESKKKTDGIFGEDDLVVNADDDGSSPQMNTSAVLRRAKRSVDKKPARKKDVVIDCKTAQCKEIHCSTSPFLETRKFAKISVTVEINLDVFSEFSDPWYSIDFTTSGEVFLRPDRSGVVLKNHHPDTRTVKTTIVSLAPPDTEEVAHWIIFVSIGSGIGLLLIILALLVKLGFFKREQKAKMEALKSKGEPIDYNPMEGESTESDITT